MDFPQLETRHFVLRAMTGADAKRLFHMYADPDVRRYVDRAAYRSIHAAGVDIDAMQLAYRRGLSTTWAITPRQRAGLIGNCSLYNRSRQPLRAEITYALARPYWAQGVMREVLSAVAEFGFERLEAQCLEARVYPNNRRSIRLLEENGFAAVQPRPGASQARGKLGPLLNFGLEPGTWRAARQQLGQKGASREV